MEGESDYFNLVGFIQIMLQSYQIKLITVHRGVKNVFLPDLSFAFSLAFFFSKHQTNVNIS